MDDVVVESIVSMMLIVLGLVMARFGGRIAEYMSGWTGLFLGRPTSDSKAAFNRVTFISGGLLGSARGIGLLVHACVAIAASP